MNQNLFIYLIYMNMNYEKNNIFIYLLYTDQILLVKLY